MSCSEMDVINSETNRIELHSGIHKIFEGYYRLGFWQRGDVATVKEKSFKIVFSIYYLLFPLSLISGAIATDNKYESMLMTQSAIITSVILTRLLYIIWRQKDIYEMLHRIGVYSIKDKEDFYVVDNKLKSFMKWIGYLSSYTCVLASFVTIVFPFIGGGKKLFFNIGFPLDYTNNDFSFWIEFLFQLTEMCITIISISFTVITWYLLFNCSLKYQVLGSDLRKIGVIRKVAVANENLKRLKVEKQNVFKRDLISAIKSHRDIHESTQQLESFLSQLFALQLATSAACICASVYILAFNKGVNVMELQIYIYFIFYNICDIFMVMYFGNEIELLSDALSYSLFQSNWIDQPQSCKLIVIIFGERLKHPQQLVIMKIYPLTLETFTKILNGAYSLFNILKTMAT